MDQDRRPRRQQEHPPQKVGREAVLCERAAYNRENAERFQSVIDAGLIEPPLMEEWARFVADARWAAERLESMLPDADLIAVYQRLRGEAGNPEADTLAAEIKRRNLDL